MVNMVCLSSIVTAGKSSKIYEVAVVKAVSFELHLFFSPSLILFYFVHLYPVSPEALQAAYNY